MNQEKPRHPDRRKWKRLSERDQRLLQTFLARLLIQAENGLATALAAQRMLKGEHGTAEQVTYWKNVLAGYKAACQMIPAKVPPELHPDTME